MKLIYWKGLSALILAALVFLGSPYLLRWLDPTAGAFDVGYLQRPVMALVYFLFATFAAWVVFQIDWPDADRWIDSEAKENSFKADFNSLSGPTKIGVSLYVFTILLAAFLLCLALVPV